MLSNSDQTADGVHSSDAAAASTRPFRRTVWIAAALVGLLVIGWIGLAQSRWGRHLQAEDLGLTWTPRDLPVREPSSIAYHPTRKTLFIVSDQGHLIEMSIDLDPLGRYDLPADLEGVTIHPETGTVFLSSEGPLAIFEFDPELQRIIRRMDVDWQAHPDFADKPLGNKGLEGIAIVGQPAMPHRLFAVVESDPARLLEFDADLSAEATKQAQDSPPDNPFGLRQRIGVRSSIDLGVDSLSDLAYDPATDQFLVVSSAYAILVVADHAGRVRRTVQLPGTKPEGLAFLPDGRALLVDDTDGLYVTTGLAEKLFQPLAP